MCVHVIESVLSWKVDCYSGPAGYFFFHKGTVPAAHYKWSSMSEYSERCEQSNTNSNVSIHYREVR